MTFEELKELGAQVPENVILSAHDGSVAHGMFDSRSADIDLRGVFMDNPFELRGSPDFVKSDFMMNDIRHEVEFFGFKKFVLKLESGDPQFLPWLWQDGGGFSRLHLGHFNSDWGTALRGERDMFLGSETIFHEFTRQANRKLRLMDPANQQKSRSEAKLSALQLESIGETREKRFREFGFDTKNAVHAIRILRMALEVFKEREFRFFRDDAEDLMDIKFGKWTMQEVQDHADELNVEVTDLFNEGDHGMPAVPDAQMIERWARQFETNFWMEK